MIPASVTLTLPELERAITDLGVIRLREAPRPTPAVIAAVVSEMIAQLGQLHSAVLAVILTAEGWTPEDIAIVQRRIPLELNAGRGAIVRQMVALILAPATRH